MTALVAQGGVALTDALAADFEVVALSEQTPVTDLELADLLVVDGSVPEALVLLKALKRRFDGVPAIWVGTSWERKEIDSALAAGATDVAVRPGAAELAARARMALAVRQAESRDLMSLAYTDELTGLANRRFLKNRLRAAMHAARTRKEPVSVLMLDIDCFKGINDRHGHQAGDRALVEFAKVLRTTSRSTDTIGRWGGEEFLYIVPGGLVAAEAQAERIRAAVAAFPFGAPELDLRLTVSIGATEFGLGDHPHDLVDRADRLLYAAKRRGRDCTVAAPAATPLAELA